MSTRPKRPITVWLAQIFLVIYAAMFVLVMGSGVIDNENFQGDYEGTFFVSFFCTAVVFSCIASCVGLGFRQRWGKWLAILMLAGVLSLFVFAAYDGAFAYAREDPDEWFIVWSIIVTLIYAPCALLLLALLLDPKVSAFFTPPPLEGSDITCE